MFGKLALKAALPSLLSQLDDGVLENFLITVTISAAKRRKRKKFSLKSR